MAVKFANLASSTLASSLSNSATSISVADASSFPTLGSGDYFYASIGEGSLSEIVKVTAVSSNTLTVVRGQDSTTARSHDSGTSIALRVVAAALDDIASQAQTAADTESVSIAGDTMTGVLLTQMDIRSAGMIRATGWYNDTASTDYYGSAIEIGTSGSHPTILAYNRSNSSYQQMIFGANTFKFNTATTFNIATADFQIGGVTVLTSARALQNVTADAGIITSGTFDSARIPAPVNGDWWNNGFVRVGTDGVMEVGKYLDFHTSDSGGNVDYDVRVTASPGAIDIDGDLTVDDITSGAITSSGAISGTALQISSGTVINTAKQAFVSSVQHSGVISFLNGTNGTSGSGAQGINVRHVYAGTNYSSGTAGAGEIEASVGFKVAGNSFINSSRNITAGTISSGAITSSGNITTSGVLQINVGSASHTRFRITRPSSTTAALYMGVDSSNNAMMAANNSALRIGKDAAGTFYEYLTVESGGNTNVKNALEINGTTAIDSNRQFSGSLASSVTATTQSASDNSTKVATTAYVTTAIDNIVDAAPGSLDTLNELAAALGDDANFSTTVTNSIATKLPLAGGTMTGRINFFTTNVQAPSSTNATTGARLNLYPQGSGRDYTIGIESSNMWFNTDGGFKWYEDGAARMQMETGGHLNLSTGSLKMNGTTVIDSSRRNIYLDSFAGGDNNGIFFRNGFTSSSLGYNASITVQDHNGASADGLHISGYDGVGIGTGANTYNVKLLVHNNGNVGIGTGTATPSKTLHVKTTGNEGIRLEGTQNGVWMDVQSSNSELWSMGADTNGWAVYNRTDSAYRFRVDNSGHVDVVSGALLIQSNTAVNKTGNYMVYHDGSGGPALYAGNTSDNRNYYQSNHHRFRSDDASTVFGELSGAGFYIGSSSTPAEKLQVAGNTRTDGKFISRQNSNNLLLETSSNPGAYYAIVEANYNYSKAFSIRAKGAGSEHQLLAWGDAAGLTINGAGGGIKLAGNGPIIVNTTSVGAANTDRGLIFDGNYTNGQYRHRWRKQDNGGGVPLYLDYAAGTANSYTTIARFGPYSGNTENLEVYGGFKATSIASTGSASIGGSATLSGGFTASANSVVNGELNVSRNGGVTGTSAPQYSDVNIELQTSSNHVPGISFHRGGHSATTLYEYNGELYTNAWVSRAQTGLLLSSGNIGSYAWTSANDGSGSGLDADLLDGVQGSNYLRSDVVDTLCNSKSSGILMSRTGFSDFIGYNPSYGSYIGGGVSNAANYLYAGGYISKGGLHTLWHSGNDGSGSGLDADLLDGKDHTNFGATLATYSTTASSSGRIRCTAPFNTNSSKMFQVTVSLYGSYTCHTYVVSGYMYSATNQWYLSKAIYTGTGSPDIVVGRDSNGKAYISIANNDYMGVRVHNMTRGYHTSVADTYDPWTITVNAATENSVTPTVSQVWHSTNDGSGSGLDADLLDGYNAAENGGNTIHKLASNGYSQINNWIMVGTAGIYSSTNSAHFSPNRTTSYGSWETTGSRGGYDGIVFGSGGDAALMFDSSGNGGMYRQAGGGWYNYFHVGNNCMGINDSTTSSSYGAYLTGAFYSTGNITAYSDRRVKENIVPIDNALEKVNQLEGVYYNRTDDPDKKREIGFIAQDVNEVTPELVTYAEDVDQYGVKYQNTTALLVEAVKTLTQQVKDLQAEIEELKNA